ncbi:MAG: hypothetical protein HA494_07315 [Thaumarchaeota archaeon]|nr:hypothetical protein [Nitrososphaerota archaeon]
MMVRSIIKGHQILYECEECHLLYREKTWAERCEEFCTKHHACSLEITKHAVRLDD